MSAAEIQRLFDERDLEALPAEPGEAAEYWRKAVRAHADSRIVSLSPENAILLAYQAALSAATAAIRAAGFRVKNRGRHHYVTFYTLAALGEGTELRELAREMDEHRGDRHVAGYGSTLNEARLRRQLAAMHELLDRLLPAVREWLLSHHPEVGDLAPAR